ncbi:MAG: hypothetical protein ACTSRZ_00965 [Promethearchaeota archaeon]
MDLKEKINNSRIFNLKNTYIYTMLWFAVTLLSYINPLIQQMSSLFALYLSGGIIVIASHFFLTSWLEKRIRLVYDFLIPHVKYKDKIQDYREDTEDWINKIFHRDYSFFRLLMLFGIIGGIILATVILILKLDLLLVFFPYFNYTKEKNLVLLLTSNVFGIISIMTLFYSFFRINIVLFGTSNIIHHFTFWELEEDFKQEYFSPIHESFSQACKRIRSEYFVQPFISLLTTIKTSMNESLGSVFIKVKDNKGEFYSSESYRNYNMKENQELQKNKIIKNPLGEVIILIVFIFLLQTSILMNLFFGIFIASFIYIISPVNPTYCYSKYIRKKYSRIMHIAIPALLIGSAIIRLFLTPNLFDSLISLVYPPYSADLSALGLLFQYILVILFYRTWYRFIKGRGVKPEEFDFNIKTPFERFCNRLGISYKVFICLTASIILIFTAINLLIFYLNHHFLYNTHLIILLCSSFFTISMINLYLGNIKLKERTKDIALTYYPYVREDKKLETKYHFYEAFSSPQMLIFSYPFALIFIIWGYSTFDRIVNFMPWLEISPFIRIPTIIIYTLLGLGFGEIIWRFYTAPHAAWHSMELTTITSIDINNSPKLFDPKPFHKQFFTIILTSLPSVILFTVGFYILISIPSIIYLFTFSFISCFFIMMTFIYNKMVKSSILKKKEAVMNN